MEGLEELLKSSDSLFGVVVILVLGFEGVAGQGE
jgi:hypothetical protein